MERIKKNKKFEKIKISIFLAYNTPRPPMSVHKIFQQRRSSRLAGPMFYDCLVLLYRLAEGPGVAREKK